MAKRDLPVSPVSRLCTARDLDSAVVPKVIAIAAMSATLAAAAAGAWTAPARPASAARCLQVPPATLSSIRSGLHASVRRKLRARATRAVKARGDFSNAPRGFSHGVYFISANLRASGTASWAVSTSFLRTGGGLAYAVGKVARRVSDLGADVPPSLLAGWGISTRTYGYAQSRACVK
jgi:hypothetical protein